MKNSLEPKEIFSSFRGATGHSQGIVSAVVFALSETREQLKQNIFKAVEFLFWTGVRMQQVLSFRPFVSRNEILEESKKLSEQTPTPMLAVLHLTPQTVEKYVAVVNQSASLSKAPEKQLEVALKNSRRAVIVVGHPESLHTLVTLLHRTEAPKHLNLDQSRVPFSKRKKEFSIKYLNVSVPFHSKQHLQLAVPLILRDFEGLGGINFQGSKLLIPVYSTKDGSDLRKDAHLTETLVSLLCTEHVDWIQATAKASLEEGVTHIIDFGPGETAGIGTVTGRNCEGSGVQVLLAGSFKGVNQAILDKSILFYTSKDKIPYAPNW